MFISEAGSVSKETEFAALLRFSAIMGLACTWDHDKY
jgi:hypothetical protein